MLANRNLLFPLVSVAVPIIVKVFFPHYGISNTTLLVDLIVLPLILIVWNSYSLIAGKTATIPQSAVLVFLGLLAGDLTGYIIWGYSTGLLTSPDGETQWIVMRLILFHASVAIVFMGCAIIISRINRKIRSDQH